MGWVGASYGSVSKQTRVSKPDSRIENRRAKLQKCRGGGMTTYPYIYIYVPLYGLSIYYMSTWSLGVIESLAYRSAGAATHIYQRNIFGVYTKETKP